MQNNEIQFKPVKRKQKGKLAQPRLQCGPGINCKESSRAACNLMKAILAHGNKVDDCSALNQCQDESVLPSFLLR